MTHPTDVIFGVIGGSGVYKMDGLVDPQEYAIDTPFGKPSDVVTIATLEGVKCAFMPRHGRTHNVTPSEVNYRANIYALKAVGVKYLLSITAVGSLVHERRPTHLCVVDQLIDRSYKRESSFFGKGCVAHVPFAHPTSVEFNKIAAEVMKASLPSDVVVHPTGTLVTMEGPQFSTTAESKMNVFLGGQLIGMTSSTESKLAREAEMAHCIIAMVTDMDAGAEDHDAVDVSMVMQTMKINTAHAQVFTKAIAKAIGANQFTSRAHSALNGGIMTTKDHIPAETYASLKLLIGKYVQ